MGAPTTGLSMAGNASGLVLSLVGQILTNVQTALGVDTVAQATGTGLSNCNVHGTFRANANGLVLQHCTVGDGVTGAGSYRLEYNFITSTGDGIDPTGSGYKVIQYNKIWRDGTRVGTKHEDGIQFWQGGNALIARNWISGWQTSAIMLKSDFGLISNVTVDSNFLDNPTGFYQLYLCPGSNGLTNVTITNNAFGKPSSTASTCGSNVTFVHSESQRQAAIAAGNKAAASWVVWNNNYVAGTTTAVAPPGGWSQ